MKYALLILAALGSANLLAQEAASGVELSGTVSVEAMGTHELTESPRDGASVAGGFRAVLYPVWKIDDHWAVSAAIQAAFAAIFRRRNLHAGVRRQGGRAAGEPQLLAIL